MRQRRPGVWEVRLAVGRDPVSGRSRYRSLAVHGDRAVAQTARDRWAAKAELVRSAGRARPGITIAALLREWLGTDHGWRPSTIAGYRSVVGFLGQDPVATRRAVEFIPAVLAAACTAWRSQRWPDPTISSRIRVLRSAVGWAYAERIVDLHPLDGMRGPPQARVRMHAPADHVRAILRHARQVAINAASGSGGDPPGASGPHRAEQKLLLARLAADSGARRGELAALQLGDLDGDVLTIARGTSNEVVGPTKTIRIRRLTLGPTTTKLWRDIVSQWRHRGEAGARFGLWLFSAAQDHSTRLTTSCLGHWFAELTTGAGYPEVTLHTLRHSVATALVSRGDMLQAQYRLGHRDAATTLRLYSRVLPLTDADAAATLERLYDID